MNLSFSSVEQISCYLPQCVFVVLSQKARVDINSHAYFCVCDFGYGGLEENYLEKIPAIIKYFKTINQVHEGVKEMAVSGSFSFRFYSP